MRPTTSSLAVVVLTALFVPCSAGLAKERTAVTVSYVLAPPQPLPDGLKGVAVIDAGVQTQGAREDERERKWSAIAADMIEAMLQNAGTQYGGGLAVAKRSQTKRILEEQDLRLSGLVEGADATRAARLLAVQGLITSRLIINIDVQKSSKSTLDWGGILGGAIQGFAGSRERAPRTVIVRPAPRVVRQPVRVDPRVRDPRATPRRGILYAPGYRPTRSPRPEVEGGGFGGFAEFGLKTKEVEEISRSLTVQCSFSLIDANTGRSLVQYSPPPFQKTDSASPDFLFGGLMDDAELDPVDHFIGELVERATREFVGMLVPVPFEQTYTLELRGKRGEAAIRAIRADDFETAARQLEAALREDDDDKGKLAFVLGVVRELQGDYAGALKMYRQAAAARDPDKDMLPVYMGAKQRLTNHMNRIMVPSAGPAGNPPAGMPPGVAPAQMQPSAQTPPASMVGPAPAASPPAPSASPSVPVAAPPAPPASPSTPPTTAPASGAVEDEIRMLEELEARDKK
ncbi:MAG TPA: tetratricopeptide repeat protein [Phycisphaerae bacterium]|nr:tetratricopeptide repeat protein [Phycisphaerae bacterium]